jgi:4-amino-4-deoxy-L-arabinose transferase-like glycosyltransferase
LILQGIPPYELAYNMKLPGTYYACAAGMAVFGQTAAGIHLTLLVVNALTIVFVFLLGRKLFGVTAGLAACASYGLMATSIPVFGMAAHATQFVVLFAVPGTLLLWRAFESGRRRAIFSSGLFFGLAFVMKQPGIYFGVFGFLVLLWRERHAASSGAESGKRIGLYVFGAALPFVIICLYLAGAGVFSQFWFWTISYARAYASRVSPGDGLDYLTAYLRNESDFFAGFWILAVAGLVVAARSTAGRTQLKFVAGFLLFSFLAVTPGLYFREHYFVLLLPALAVTVGMAVAVLQSMPARWMKYVPVILLAGVLTWGAWLQRWAFFAAPPLVFSGLLYRPNPFIESVTVARYIRDHSAKNARVAVIGSEPQIYFYAQRHSATGYIYTYPLMENQPYAVTMQHQMINEIETAKPQYLVIVVNRYSWLPKASSALEIFGWAEKYAATNYDRVGIVDYSLGKPEIRLLGVAAKNYSGKPEQCLEIYQRKPDAS